MKNLSLLIFLIPFTLFGQENGQQQVVMRKADSSTFVINIMVSPNTKGLSDSIVLKSLLDKLNKKDEKSFWDKYSGLFVALIPIVLGYFAYTYTRRQSITNARLEWVKNFRPVVSRFITGTLKSQTALEELNNVAELLEEKEKNVNEAAERLTKLLVDKQLMSTDNPKMKEVEKSVINEEEKAKETVVQNDIAHKEFKNYYEKYKIESFDLYQSLNEVLVSLDPQTYGITHQNLNKTINEMLSYDFEEGRDGFDKLIERVRLDIQKVLAEQWQMAQGS